MVSVLYFRFQNEDKFCYFPCLDLRDDDEDMKITKFTSTDNTLDHNNRPTHILSEKVNFHILSEKVCLHIFSEGNFSRLSDDEICVAPPSCCRTRPDCRAASRKPAQSA